MSNFKEIRADNGRFLVNLDNVSLVRTTGSNLYVHFCGDEDALRLEYGNINELFGCWHMFERNGKEQPK